VNALKVICGLVIIFITLPIWFYLLYKILVIVNATDLMWFLYYIYVPFTIFASVLAKIVEKSDD
jgi:hypothetical protein